MIESQTVFYKEFYTVTVFVLGAVVNCRTFPTYEEASLFLSNENNYHLNKESM